jgi:NADH-quinone oxidoreductase subunit G
VAPAAGGAITPAHDTLFTSATLGRYSKGLRELEEHQAAELAGTAAD